MALGDAKASATILCVVCGRLSQSICLNIRLARFMSCVRGGKIGIRDIDSIFSQELRLTVKSN